MNESTKLYSKQAVLLATFLGGPLGGCILMRRNSLNLGRNREGNITLLIGILAMILLGAIGFLEIGEVFNRSMRLFLPALSVGICSIYVEKLYGEALAKHQREGQSFYSMWRAAGIGGVILAVVLSMVICGSYLEKNTFDIETYQQLEAEFLQNQGVVEQLNDFDHSRGSLDVFIDQTILPKLNRNIELCQKMLAIEPQPNEFRTYAEQLEQFTRLQIEKCRLIYKALTTGESVQRELANVQERIDKVVAKINAEDQ